jgi:hypothetical protein
MSDNSYPSLIMMQGYQGRYYYGKRHPFPGSAGGRFRKKFVMVVALPGREDPALCSGSSALQ